MQRLSKSLAVAALAAGEVAAVRVEADAEGAILAVDPAEPTPKQRCESLAYNSYA